MGTWVWAGGVRPSCVLKSCTAPVAPENGSVTSPSPSSTGHNVRCNSGFALHKGDVAVSSGYVECNHNVEPKTVNPCGNASDACCTKQMTHDFTCKPKMCVDPNPCGSTLANIVADMNADNTYAIGSVVGCNCKTGNQGGTCTTVCTDDGSNDAAKFVIGACACTPPQCPPAKTIPHGSVRFVGTEASLPRGFGSVEYAAKLNLGEIVTYHCDANYQLKFTHNDANAVEAQCYRQCYQPAEYEAGNPTKLEAGKAMDTCQELRKSLPFWIHSTATAHRNHALPITSQLPHSTNMEILLLPQLFITQPPTLEVHETPSIWCAREPLSTRTLERTTTPSPAQRRLGLHPTHVFSSDA